MATYTVTLTDLQDAALDAYREAVNVDRQANNLPTYADNQALIAAEVTKVIFPAVESFVGAHINRIVDAIRADPTVARITAVEQAAGVSDGR
jgi:hypothetical protein